MYTDKQYKLLSYLEKRKVKITSNVFQNAETKSRRPTSRISRKSGRPTRKPRKHITQKRYQTNSRNRVNGSIARNKKNVFCSHQARVKKMEELAKLDVKKSPVFDAVRRVEKEKNNLQFFLMVEQMRMGEHVNCGNYTKRLNEVGISDEDPFIEKKVAMLTSKVSEAEKDLEIAIKQSVVKKRVTDFGYKFKTKPIEERITVEDTFSDMVQKHKQNLTTRSAKIEESLETHFEENVEPFRNNEFYDKHEHILRDMRNWQCIDGNAFQFFEKFNYYNGKGQVYSNGQSKLKYFDDNAVGSFLKLYNDRECRAKTVLIYLGVVDVAKKGTISKNILSYQEYFDELYLIDPCVDPNLYDELPEKVHVKKIWAMGETVLDILLSHGDEPLAVCFISDIRDPNYSKLKYPQDIPEMNQLLERENGVNRHSLFHIARKSTEEDKNNVVLWYSSVKLHAQWNVRESIVPYYSWIRRGPWQKRLTGEVRLEASSEWYVSERMDNKCLDGYCSFINYFRSKHPHVPNGPCECIDCRICGQEDD